MVPFRTEILNDGQASGCCRRGGGLGSALCHPRFCLRHTLTRGIINVATMDMSFNNNDRHKAAGHLNTARWHVNKIYITKNANSLQYSGAKPEGDNDSLFK